ncbi:MAG: saccharopine dehydrogenase NADP-binding domain-containing protein [Candidatus Delongbacteria bacterium]|jgi:saccharopine dehydrogenase-like NADP-dependent oxidoreductase|nr:saccharopine dehydrogenase NADP-binding domain-containing protein [Candidatus Delongbacteria bacterium]
MKRILVLGAGLSATSLIDYLLKHSEIEDWQLRIGNRHTEKTREKIAGHPRGEAIKFDVQNQAQIDEEVKGCDIAVSFLPARFHALIAEACVKHGKHMVTASYVSKEMQALDKSAKDKGIVMLNELGVDPGIDHMSAMRVIDDIRDQGGKMLAFSSSTGGLIAPEYDNNPWHYKFTWNPRNVVLAGQATSCYLENNKYKYIPYHQLFTRTAKTEVLDFGKFEIYPNRDSLSYRKTYGLEDIPSIFRGTFRRPGYCKAWNVFVQLGLTDDTVIYEGDENTSYREFINSFLPYDPERSVEDKICSMLHLDPDGEIMEKFEWLGIFEDTPINMKNASPAEILQSILEEKLALGENDKDMIVMQHKFVYEQDGVKKGRKSSFAYIGKDQTQTAMAITVGIPAAIAVRLLAIGEIKLTGVHTPVIPELYNPILDELEKYDIQFIEEDMEV